MQALLRTALRATENEFNVGVTGVVDAAHTSGRSEPSLYLCRSAVENAVNRGGGFGLNRTLTKSPTSFFASISHPADPAHPPSALPLDVSAVRIGVQTFGPSA